MSKTVVVKTYPNRAEAEVVKGFLEEKGVKAIVLGAELQQASYSGLWGSAGWVRLVVREEDREEALRLLEGEGETDSKANKYGN